LIIRKPPPSVMAVMRVNVRGLPEQISLPETGKGFRTAKTYLRILE